MENVIDWFNGILYNIKSDIRDFKYWVLYRCHPNYFKYWSVKPSTLNIQYHDTDTLLLHSCFQLVTDFYEEIIFHGTTDWDYSENHRNVIRFIKECYVWWNVDRPKLEIEISELYGKYVSYGDEHSKRIDLLEKQIFDTDTQMLCQLIKYRAYLWE
jgi:hypothetical protein